MGPQQIPVPACGPGPTVAGAVPKGQSTAWVSVGSPGAGWGQQPPPPGAQWMLGQAETWWLKATGAQ